MAIQRAREANMPMDTIERAIKRGTGGGDAAALEEIVYEGYGPGGVAILIEATTDNRNRAAAEIRSTLTRAGGSLGESGCVAWNFESRGVIEAQIGSNDPEEVELLAIDAGADDFHVENGTIEVYTAPADVERVRHALEGAACTVLNADVSMVPKTTVTLSEQDVLATLRMIEKLEELDDVQHVYSNLEIPERVLAQLGAR
jgi:YebC/PmpR family DNA-binding regulatory protein